MFQAGARVSAKVGDEVRGHMAMKGGKDRIQPWDCRDQPSALVTFVSAVLALHTRP